MAMNKLSAGGDRSLDSAVIDVAIRLGFLGLLAFWSMRLVAPFAIIIIWSVILAVAIYPIHDWISARLGGRSRLTSFLVTLVGMAIILGPAGLLVTSAIDSVEALSTALKAGTLKLPPVDDRIKDWPLIGEKLHAFWTDGSENLMSLANRHQDWILSKGGGLLGVVAGLGVGILQFAASILIAGFLFGPGPELANRARGFAQRIVAHRGAGFVDLAGATIRNVSRGVVGISLLQALLAGLGLMVAAVPAAGLITLGVLILGLIQIGPGILLIPIIIWVWTAADTVTALLFTVYMLPVTLLDNILKPIVMAKGLETPMLVIFIGVIGGTLAHGLIGLFLGPIVLAVFYELLVVWVRGPVPADPATDAAKDAG